MTQKIKITLIITGVVVVALVAVMAFLLTSKSKDIKVGNARYMSACSVLPESSVSAIFGKLPGSTVVASGYVDESLPNSRRDLAHDYVDTHCTYQHEEKLENGPVLKVHVRQLTRSEDQNDETYAAKVPISAEAVTDSLKQYEAVGGSLKDADAKAFLGHIKTSSKTYIEKKDAVINGTDKQDKTSDTRLSGTTFPAPKTGSTLDDDALAFVGIEKDFIVTVTHQLAKEEKAEKKYTPAELEAELVAMKKAFETIRKNLNDPELSQAPRAAFSAGKQKTGTTQLLDPCQILDAATFERITSVKQNDIVTSKSMRHDAQETEYSSVSLPASSNCVRNYHALLLPDSYKLTEAEQKYSKQGGIEVALQLWQDQNKQEAEKVWAEIAKQENCDAVTTTADKAISCVKDSDQTETVYFLSGPYIGGIEIVAFGKTQQLKGDALVIEAINIVVTNIQAAQNK